MFGQSFYLKLGEGSFFLPSSVGKQSQLLLKPTEFELALQVGNATLTGAQQSNIAKFRLLDTPINSHNISFLTYLTTSLFKMSSLLKRQSRGDKEAPKMMN